MRFQDLSREDQNLVNSDFGGLDKVAEEQVKIATEMYNGGAELAEATADQMDKTAAEAEYYQEDDTIGEAEKVASADFGNIIAEGFIDKLAELGEERYGNPAHYVMPYVEEKIAQVGAQAALEKFAGAKESFMKMLSRKGGEASKAVKGAYKDTKKFTGRAIADTKAAVTGRAAPKAGSRAKGKELSGMERVKLLKRPGMVAGGGLALGGTGYAANRLMSKKQED